RRLEVGRRLPCRPRRLAPRGGGKRRWTRGVSGRGARRRGSRGRRSRCGSSDGSRSGGAGGPATRASSSTSSSSEWRRSCRGGGAAVVQWRAGFGGTLAYGVAVSAAIAVVVARGTFGPPLSSPGFEALARESDAPHRTWYVVVPWFATALGGVAANLLAPHHAAFGYLVVGLADAVGEPVGI